MRNIMQFHVFVNHCMPSISPKCFAGYVTRIFVPAALYLKRGPDVRRISSSSYPHFNVATRNRPLFV